MEILIPILAVTVIGLICAVGLAVASSVMAVKEDTRFTEIRACLPGANCGACGYTGCDGYAKALLEPGTKTNLCVPGADAVAAQIAALLGVEAEDVVEKIAVVQCAGTCEATSVKADYRGIPSCAAAKLFYGGNGSCIFGCMGFGDCARACPQNAICMQDGIACVNHTACIGCGICAQTCPQKIIEIVPDIIRTEVLCSSYHNGPYTRKVCSSGCIGCHKCEKTCPQGAITVDNFLARIDWDKCTACGECAKVCPTGAISFVEREAAAYDEAAVQQHMAQKKTAFHGCPGSATKLFQRQAAPAGDGTIPSQLAQWPCQIRLISPGAPCFAGAHLLIAADCTAYAYADFHRDFMQGRVTLIGCPKLDAYDYAERLTAILAANSIQSVTLLRMEVPCCGGLERAAVTALKNSGKFIPWQVVTVTLDGRLKEE